MSWSIALLPWQIILVVTGWVTVIGMLIFAPFFVVGFVAESRKKQQATPESLPVAGSTNNQGTPKQPTHQPDLIQH